MKSFIDGTFPSDRMIRRSLQHRLKSYYMHRLSDKLKDLVPIKLMKKKFYRISKRRNEIGHSGGSYARDKDFTQDFDILLSTN